MKFYKLPILTLLVIALIAGVVRAGGYGHHANFRAAVFVQPAVYTAPQTLIAPVVGDACVGAIGQTQSNLNYEQILNALQAPVQGQAANVRTVVQQPVQTVVHQQGYLAPVRTVQFQSAGYGHSANVAFVSGVHHHARNVQFVTTNSAPKVEKVVTERRRGLFGLRKEKVTKTTITK